MPLVLMLAAASCTERSPRWDAATSFAPLRLPTDAALPVAAADTVEIRPAGRRAARPPVIERGGESALGRPRSERRLAPSGNGFTLDFVDAEIAEVARAILGEALERPYLIEPGVTGRISLSTAGPVAREALAQILAGALEANGHTLIEDGTTIRILPVARAGASGAPVRVDRVGTARPPGYAIEVVALGAGSAAELARLVEPLVRDGATVVADSARNLLVLGGTRAQRDMLLDLVDIFDIDWMRGMSLGLFPLRIADPLALVGELQLLFDLQPGEPNQLRFVPVSRLGAVLVVARSSAALASAQRWIAQLDQDSGEDEARLYVYPVQNGRAADLAELMSEIFGAGRGRGAEPSGGIAPGLVPVTLATGVPPTTEGESAAAPLDIGPAGRGADVAATRIIADRANNALVVLARPQLWQMIRQALERLDAEPQQVLIEATIAEITLNDELRYGVEWFLRANNLELRLTNTPSPEPTGQFPGFSALFTSGNDVRVILNALSAVTDVNVISSPQLLVLDNQTAELQVGDQVPVAVQTAQSISDPNAPLINTIEYRDTGVILQVLPRVNASGRTTLEIAQEISDVVPTTTSGLNSPTIRQRRVRSTVVVASGESVALGGLIREDRNRTRRGVPILHELPVVGPLFGARADVARRTEILILLTPYVIRSTAEVRAVTEELRRRVRALAPL
jgi:general secretion pathway protein D